jgi:hypothetical protein
MRRPEKRRTRLSYVAVFAITIADVIVFIDVTLDVVGSIANSVLGFAPGILDLALYLLGCAFGLGLGVACPLANLALHAAGDIVSFSFDTIAIHSGQPPSVRSGCGSLVMPF